MTYRYQVCFEQEEDGGYHAFVPALRGCHSYGRTFEEAQRQVADAIALYVEGLQKHGVPVPRPANGYVGIVEVEVKQRGKAQSLHKARAVARA